MKKPADNEASMYKRRVSAPVIAMDAKTRKAMAAHKKISVNSLKTRRQCLFRCRNR